MSVRASASGLGLSRSNVFRCLATDQSGYVRNVCLIELIMVTQAPLPVTTSTFLCCRLQLCQHEFSAQFKI